MVGQMEAIRAQESLERITENAAAFGSLNKQDSQKIFSELRRAASAKDRIKKPELTRQQRITVLEAMGVEVVIAKVEEK